MKIFIDTSTGTWGNAEDIVLVDADEGNLYALDRSSDSEIIGWGDEVGKRLPMWLLMDPDGLY